MIPEGWSEATVGEAFETGRGRVISRHEIEANAGEYPVYSSQSTNNGEFGRIASYDFDGEYVTWTTDGANAGTVFYREGKFNCTNVCGTLKSNNKFDVDLRFMAYFLGTRTKQYVSYVGNPKLMNNIMQKIPVLLPPLPEQKRIAEVLGSVDAAIEATQGVIAQTKQVKQGLLQTLLTRGIGHTKFKPSPLGEIPEAWEVRELDDSGIAVIDGDRGGEYPNGDDFQKIGHCLFLNAKNVTKNGFRFEECQFITEAKHRQLRKGTLERGDLVVTTRGTIGNIALYSEGVPFDIIRINSGMVILRNSKTQMDTKFLGILLDSPVVDLQIKTMSFGSAQQQLTVGILNALNLPIPPLPEQRAIAEIFEGVDSQIIAETTKLASLQQLKKGLMHDLLTGKVRVQVVEPALKLVENKKQPRLAIDDFRLIPSAEPIYIHGLLRAEIVSQLGEAGAKKIEKVVSLAARHCGLEKKIDRTESRAAAGPYDGPSRHKVDAIFLEKEWFTPRPDEDKVIYKRSSNYGGHKQDYQTYLSDHATSIQDVINLLKDETPNFCEGVATLYAAWNDLLLDGKRPTEAEIFAEFWAWHADKKKNFSKLDLENAIAWMRRKELVPTGRGRKTKVLAK